MEVEKIKDLLRELDTLLVQCERDRSELFGSLLRRNVRDASSSSIRLDAGCARVRAIGQEITDLLREDEDKEPKHWSDLLASPFRKESATWKGFSEKWSSLQSKKLRQKQEASSGNLNQPSGFGLEGLEMADGPGKKNPEP